MGREMPQDEEFYQIHMPVLKYTFDVNKVTVITLRFCCPLWA